MNSMAPVSYSSSTTDHNECKQGVIRSTVNFHRSIWGDQFLTYDERKDQAWEEEQAKELREKVRKELVITTLTKPMQHVKLMELIDAVQRLGVAYHFEEEIEESLNHIFVTYGDQWINDNLQITSLWFRLLRQHGFNVSSGIFKKYMDNNGKFLESLRNDVQGMLSLYEAAYLRVEGEEVLDAAIEFTTSELENIAKNHVGNDDSLKIQIQQALRQPLRKRLPMLEALRYIPIYEHESSHNEDLLKLAKLDFNLVQSLHRKELSQISKYV
ncbi:(E)-beta-farnesene synthase-like [Cynara cardunculus var. scolymus]|uniref:(E)-beta-farnesene synthase-like n=1 Tax=Cynara cardunculus var. scolymus TaxID=59895 RepID=UPI000D62F975|nr:(E)-beta-farnesene synthase-like [Cynara cardunculus var. scolymus]